MALRGWWTTIGKPAIKVLIGALVLAAVGRHVVKTWGSLAEHRSALRLEPAWIAVALASYLAGLVLFGLFYGRVLRSSPSPIGLVPSLRAYLISHLGKYVPGKALVVVMRAGLSATAGARPATAAFATLYETLVMMAAGGLVASVGFALPPSQWVGMGVGLGIGVGFLGLVEPRVFPRLSRLASLPFPGVGPEALPRFSWGLLTVGLLLSAAGWTLLGLSQVAIVLAVAPAGVAVGLWPQVIAGVALATVAGFVVAIFPGGLVVREGVLMWTLAPLIGEELSVVSALALRLTWVAGEGLAAAAVAPWRSPRAQPVEPC